MPSAETTPLYQLSAACIALTETAPAPSPPIAALRVADGGLSSHRDHHFTQLTHFSLQLRAEDGGGRPLPRGAACANHIRVGAAAFAANGSLVARALPTVVVTPSEYSVAVTLWRTEDATSWSISASVVWEGFDRAGWWHRTDPHARDDTGCRQPPLEQPNLLMPPLQLVVPLAAPPAAPATPGPLAAQYPTTDRVDALEWHATCSRRVLQLGGLHRVPALRSVGGCTQDGRLPCSRQGPLLWRPADVCGSSERVETADGAAAAGGAARAPTTTRSTRAPHSSSSNRARAALDGKWVLFVGASTHLEIFFFLLSHVAYGGGFPYYQKLEGPLVALKDTVFNAEARSCAGRPNYWHRDFDTCVNASLRACHPAFHSHKIPSNLRLSVLYDGHTSACKASMGFASLLSVDPMTGAAVPTRRGEWLRSLISGGNATPGWLRERFAAIDKARQSKMLNGGLRDDGASLGWPNGPDVIVLGSGVHDLGSRSFSLASYAAHARAVWELIVGAIPERRRARPQLIWVSTGGVYVRPEDKRRRGQPKGANATGGNMTYCPMPSDPGAYSHPIPVLREMDVLTRRLAHEYGADILDQAKVRELSPYDGDGLHCVRGITCQGTLDALLTLLEADGHAE